MVATSGRRHRTRAREEKVGYLSASSKGQKEKPLYLKMNFTERDISLHLFLAHGVLNCRSHFISKMSLLKYIFYFHQRERVN